VLLTPLGERVVERARQALSDVEEIYALARSQKDPASGTLRIGLFPTLAPYLLPHVVPKVHELFPNLELLLVEEKTAVVVERLREGKLDAGILARPVDDDSLHEEPMFVEEFVLATPADHPLARAGAPVDPSVLVTENILLLEEGHCLRDQALEVCDMVGASERSGFRATSLETLRQMVAADVGITLLPRLAVEPPVPSPSNVAIVPFKEPAPRREIAMYWRRTRAHPEFLASVADVFADLPPDLVTRASSEA
jgi:LysR family hydrogen peroxide-inducible transcriptional activator